MYEAYREPLGSVHFNHAAQQVLTVRRDEVRHVENSQLHLLQQIPQVVIIERQSTLKEEEKHVTNMSAEIYVFIIWVTELVQQTHT